MSEYVERLEALVLTEKAAGRTLDLKAITNSSILTEVTAKAVYETLTCTRKVTDFSGKEF